MPTPEPLCCLKTVASTRSAILLLDDQAPWGQDRRRKKMIDVHFPELRKRSTRGEFQAGTYTVLHVVTWVWIRRVCCPDASLNEVRNLACCESHRGDTVVYDSNVTTYLLSLGLMCKVMPSP